MVDGRLFLSRPGIERDRDPRDLFEMCTMKLSNVVFALVSILWSSFLSGRGIERDRDPGDFFKIIQMKLSNVVFASVNARTF